jgi:hypothetical protein
MAKPLAVAATLTLTAALAGSVHAAPPDEATFFAKHGGKILFADKAIARDVMLNARYSDRFKLGEEVHWRGFFAKSTAARFAELGTCGGSVNVVISAGLDGGAKATLETYSLSAGEAAEQTLRSGIKGSFVPVAHEALDFPRTKDLPAHRFASLLPALRVGDNTVTVTMDASCSADKGGAPLRVELARGTFTLELGKGFDRRSVYPAMPKAEGRDTKELADSLKKSVAGYLERDRKQKLKVLSVIVTEADWTEETDRFGKVVSRRRGFVVIDRAGDVCSGTLMTVREQGGKRSFEKHVGSDLPCDIAK